MIPTGRIVKVKTVLLSVLAIPPLTAQAERITLQLNEQTDTANGALFRYSNSIYYFVYKKNSKYCPKVKTFSNEK